MNGNNIEKAKEIIKSTASFIDSIKLEEGKAPDKGAIVFKFDNGKILSPVMVGAADIIKAKQTLDFIIKDLERARDFESLPDDVKQSLTNK